jgi:hypothetical protein
MSPAAIPKRAETLQILRLMGDFEPILMLIGDDQGYGTRWIVAGQPIQPAIARYLMESGFIADNGKTELGARKLTLTEMGREFRDKGLRWWAELNFFQKLQVTLFG